MYYNFTYLPDGSFIFKGYLPSILDHVAAETSITFEVVP
eukprot:gene3250-44894_t